MRYYEFPPKSDRCVKYVQIIHHQGLLQRHGAQAELARILGVSRQYVNHVVKQVMAEGTATMGIERAYGFADPEWQ